MSSSDFESAADRAAMLSSTTGLGEAWSKGGTAFDAIFDDEDADVLGIEGTGPRITVTDETIADRSLARGDTVVRSSDATSWVIREVEPDGKGITVLILEEA